MLCPESFKHYFQYEKKHITCDVNINYIFSNFVLAIRLFGVMVHQYRIQATGLDAWASRVKCKTRFVSHLHEICIYIWVVYSLCFFCCLFITVTWWYVWCFEWASGNQEELQACLVTLWLFIISCYSLYKTTRGLFCSWFENNPHFHKYSMDFHV